MILCGWCGRSTANDDRCTSCGHTEPGKPYHQRGLQPPAVVIEGGRPTLVPSDVARKIASARHHLGPDATDEALAEHLDVSPRTFRRWKQMAG